MMRFASFLARTPETVNAYELLTVGRSSIERGTTSDLAVRLCAAQLALEAGNVEQNIEKHLALIDAAVAHQADLIYFPELSLTGYEPKLAGALATDAKDRRLDAIQDRADEGKVVIGVGMPLRVADGVRIAMILLRPRNERLIYAKQLLHVDELPFFVHGEEQLILPRGGHVLAPAICYESLQASHADTAARVGADVYLASVAKSQRMVAKAYDHYPQIANSHFVAVLMANSVGPCDDFVSAGQSAAWNGSGQLVASMTDTAEGFVLFDTSAQKGAVVTL